MRQYEDVSECVVIVVPLLYRTRTLVLCKKYRCKFSNCCTVENGIDNVSLKRDVRAPSYVEYVAIVHNLSKEIWQM